MSHAERLPEHPNADLIAEIDAFLAARGISATALGARALNDPSFYATLLRGRDCRRSTVQRLRAFMRAVESEAHR